MQGRNSGLGIQMESTHISSDPYGNIRPLTYFTLETLNHQFKVFSMTKYASSNPRDSLSSPLVSHRDSLISPCHDRIPISDIPLVISPKPYIPPYRRAVN